ncbi:hypothetical protein CVT26_015454 [Gymnopilus dilepis]|uniref:Uncharacterized protein n=1 Tax=Gymnopilus dilepis TaxID=231916 RepID=A0A409W4D9_9AGAR|nr:hypothetical protein CVT26_015454 [Gymnopilus dilepis]
MRMCMRSIEVDGTGSGPSLARTGGRARTPPWEASEWSTSFVLSDSFSATSIHFSLRPLVSLVASSPRVAPPSSQPGPWQVPSGGGMWMLLHGGEGRGGPQERGRVGAGVGRRWPLTEKDIEVEVEMVDMTRITVSITWGGRWLGRMSYRRTMVSRSNSRVADDACYPLARWRSGKNDKLVLCRCQTLSRVVVDQVEVIDPSQSIRVECLSSKY